MKTFFLTTLCLFYLSISTINAQVKIKQITGKMIIGQDRTNDDYDNILTASVFGPNGDNRGGSKLAFGDFGTYNNWSWNVFIGEYTDYDYDRLWLHGKNGIYLTYNRGDDIIGYYDVNVNANRFIFNLELMADAYYTPSDLRFKTNVKILDNSMSQLSKLNGVSYNLLPKLKTQYDSSKNDTTSNLSLKEKKDKAFFNALAKQRNQNSPTRIGFIAQDLQKVFPDLVQKDSSGYLSIDYIGLIPVIVEALKEQQQIIDVQSLKIKELDTLLTNCCNKFDKPSKNFRMLDSSTSSTDATNNAFLFQNVPNPFTLKTEIRFFLPDNILSSAIYIFDLQGSLIKTFVINNHGQGKITINGNELNAGMYFYTLVADNKEVDTKRMILTQQ